MSDVSSLERKKTNLRKQKLWSCSVPLVAPNETRLHVWRGKSPPRKDPPKHELPRAGKCWSGPVEESRLSGLRLMLLHTGRFYRWLCLTKIMIIVCLLTSFHRTLWQGILLVSAWWCSHKRSSPGASRGSQSPIQSRETVIVLFVNSAYIKPSCN